MRHKIKGGLLAVIGYVLSPVSWWNDLLVNIPLAYVFALPFGLISKKVFLPAMILGYWLTNVIGFIMMHNGVCDIVSIEKKKYTKKEFIKDILLSIIYTLVVAICFLMGVVKTAS